MSSRPGVMDNVQPEARLRAALQALDAWPAEVESQRVLTDAFLRYLSLLVKWNRTYNLTAVREPERMLVQHLFDCAAVASPLKRLVAERRAPHCADDGRALIIDVGSGAGLPGIVLALLWPEAEFVLVEPVAKKAAFLQQVTSELALANVTVARTRIEDLSPDGRAPDAVVCRAFASLADFAASLDSLAGPHTVVAAMKARLDENEKRALTGDWRIGAELPLQVPEMDAPRCLVMLERGEPLHPEQEPSSGAGTE
ncbi:MAG: 16S rRNA (guanine(527)-N(7))-methyltransferase RsmG [Burkholderiaceae bacterium]|nr:16S rRNA (guanine(527)-N(7))-methyltransferase RsmG [Burkholderiaceae bacterium]